MKKQTGVEALRRQIESERSTGKGRKAPYSEGGKRSMEMTKVELVATAGPVDKQFVLMFPSGVTVAGLTWDELSSLVRGAQ